ncbi:bifunctional nuclease family protein [Halarchaeum salinum]|uniref:bifunctional nuclease family protein n=1 Tax=Halarchaeum salinum TaxID=489912 RepID=UPI001B877D49
MDADIGGVKVAGTSDGPAPVVLVEVGDEGDVLPIFIAFEEAMSIAHGIDAADIGRPLTHDLLLDVIEALGGRLLGVEIRSEAHGTYYADVNLRTPRGETTVDARPSDALALAARTDAPIRVNPDVFEAGRRERAAFDDLQDIREVAAE